MTNSFPPHAAPAHAGQQWPGRDVRHLATGIRLQVMLEDLARWSSALVKARAAGE